MGHRVRDVKVIQRDAPSPDLPEANYPGISPGIVQLPCGYQKTPDHRAFRTDTVFERDITIPLRDGTILRGDVFRPANTVEPVPILLAWSPYGKSGTGFFGLDIVPLRVGVPQSKLSGFESFEAPDPAEWTARGYAIVNVNARGAFDSDGDLRWHSTAGAEDGYDAIEYLATLPWCSGRVAMVGNSWLAMMQWFIAAEQPPHLTCIAPLEGCSDLYRETLCRGGVPYTPFWGALSEKWLFGRNQAENPIAMLDKFPLMNEYWADKRARLEKIKIPAYILASYSTGLHTVGSFRGFEDIQHDQKWLRVHATQEWFDLYSDECTEDLQLYFDYFLKDSRNGWEKTPPVRLSVLPFTHVRVRYLNFQTWPVPGTTSKTLYLHQNHTLQDTPPDATSVLSYMSDLPSLQMDNDGGELSFEYTFARKTYLIGYPRAELYMSTVQSDDMDVFVSLRKADLSGRLLRNINIPLENLGVKEASDVPLTNPLVYLGPTGILRASHRKIDVERSKPHWPLHTHDIKNPLGSGQVVKLDIGIWPAGMVFEAGEKLCFRVAGHHMILAEFESLRGGFKTGNKGEHRLHLSPENSSRIVLPIIEQLEES
ncbi:Alpha/Beta hydrolase protein [Colletotrichum cereale]|nr:Alpha/Beta hydrolase protein [Colletotrichum cereale]